MRVSEFEVTKRHVNLIFQIQKIKLFFEFGKCQLYLFKLEDKILVLHFQFTSASGFGFLKIRPS